MGWRWSGEEVAVVSEKSLSSSVTERGKGAKHASPKKEHFMQGEQQFKGPETGMYFMHPWRPVGLE